MIFIFFGQVILSSSNPKTWFSALLPESVPPQNVKRTRFILVASLLLAAVLLILVLWELDWSRFFEILRNARYTWMPMVFAWGSLSYFIRAVRWRILIQSEKPVRLRDVFWANMAGYLGNNILPARAGELTRAAYLGAKAQISVTFILATGLAERLVDLVALIMIGSFALAASGLVSAPLQKALSLMTLFGIIALVIMLLLPRFGRWMEKIFIVLPLIGDPLKKRLVELLRQFLHGLRALLDFRRATGFGLLTLLIWFMDGLGTVFVGYVLIIHITLLQSFVLLAGLGLSSAIPSTPGYVGVYQFVAIMILVPFGLDRETAIAFALVLQIIGLLSVAVWGGISLWKLNRLDKSGGAGR